MFHKGLHGAPPEIMEHHQESVHTKKDYHKKGLLRLRMEHHVITGFKTWARENKTNPSEVTAAFVSALLYGKQAKKLRQLVEKRV